MSVHTNHPATRKAILELKQTLNPITNRSHTYAEIGAILGMSAQAVYHYVKDIKGCPGCLRKLRRAKL